jgi:AAA+ ATPase superfamily predicted ATPase
MKRMNPYDVPHKGLRNALAQMQLLAGKTNYSNQNEVEQLYKLGEDVFKILTIHATDENEVTLAALEQRCPGCSQHDIEDHEQIHLAQDKLEKLLVNIYTNSMAGQDVTEEGAEFYLAFSEFHGIYLEHTAEEERVTQPMLWKYFTDEELITHRGKIMAKNPTQTLLIWFRFVIPSQSHKENVGLLTGFKKMAPKSFYDEGIQVIKQVLSEKEFDELNKWLA